MRNQWSLQLDFDGDGEEADLFAGQIDRLDLVDPERVEVIHELTKSRIVVEADDATDLDRVVDYFRPMFRELDVKQGVDRGRPCQWAGCETWGRLHHNNALVQNKYWIPVYLCDVHHAEWNAHE